MMTPAEKHNEFIKYQSNKYVSVASSILQGLVFSSIVFFITSAEPIIVKFYVISSASSILFCQYTLRKQTAEGWILSNQNFLLLFVMTVPSVVYIIIWMIVREIFIVGPVNAKYFVSNTGFYPFNWVTFFMLILLSIGISTVLYFYAKGEAELQNLTLE